MPIGRFGRRKTILSGVSEHRYKRLYSGDIDVAIYEAKPLTLRIKDFSVDEFVTVVSGTLILTAEGGSPQRLTSARACWYRKDSPELGKCRAISENWS